MTTVIRAARADDLPALLALVQSAYRGESAKRGWTHEADLLDGQRTDAAALADLLADPTAVLLVAEADGSIVGCVEVRAKDANTAYLGMLSVEPARQAGGLGKVLIAAAEAAARADGARTMEMTVISRRTELVAYYERRGYALTGEERPFPQDVRFGVPKAALAFVVLAKPL